VLVGNALEKNSKGQAVQATGDMQPLLWQRPANNPEHGIRSFEKGLK
jgi:hypothetical protein